MNLEEATRLAGRQGAYRIELSNEWEVWGPNGGYLAAIALRAAGMEAQIRRPAILNCHFLASPDFSWVDIEVSALRQGKRSEAFSVSMKQNNRLVLHAIVRTAAPAAGYAHHAATIPNVPKPESLRSGDEIWANSTGPRYKFWNNIESRPINQTTSYSGSPVRRDWVRFRPQTCFDDPFVDAARSVILIDTYGWPAAWIAHQDGRYIAPNLDTSVWFHRNASQSEWLLIDHQSPSADEGLVSVNGNVWNEAGQLVASGSGHLCCLPTPSR